MRVLLLLVPILAACADDSPSLELSLHDDTLTIALVRSPEHSFGHVTATANGIDCGAPELAAGSEGIAFSQAPSGASAIFHIPTASLGESLHVVVVESGTSYVADVPTFATPRTLHLLTALDHPLHAGDWVELSTGVDTDFLEGGMEIKQQGEGCDTQWATDLRSTSVAYQISPDIQHFWYCVGGPPPAGTLISATLSLDLWPSAAVATCKGDGLTCEPISLAPLHLDAPFQLQF
jgi:hypothetical protein